MPVFKLIVLTNPVEGKEAAFDDWYTNQHIPDLVALPNTVSGQRFRIGAEAPWRYAALYELEGESAAACLADMASHMGTPAVRMTDALDRQTMLALPLEPIGERVTK